MSDLAVIFDMDGVLIDSYHAHLASWQATAAELGSTFTNEQFAATFGRTSRETILARWPELRDDEEEIARRDSRKELLFREILDRHMPVMPGALDLLKALYRDGFALALGTSAPPENVEQVLDRLKLDELFDAVITRADVTRGKPDPQVFLRAAARVRIPPEYCAVVEDAPAGIEAALAAEMTAIGVASTGRTRDCLAAATLVVDTLGELSPQRIGDLILGRLEGESEVSEDFADEEEPDTE